MSEMVERVAKAILAQEYSPTDYPFESAPEHEKREYLGMARAAIAAMREPTEGMLKAQGTEMTGAKASLGGYLDYFEASEVWTAMINEALK